MNLVILTSLEASCRDAGLRHLQKHHAEAIVICYDYLEGHRILRHVGGTAAAERAESTLEHGCLGCATKFEILPTVLRLAPRDTERTVLLALPPTWHSNTVLDIMIPHLASAGHQVSSVALAFDPASLEDQMWDRHTLWESGFNAIEEDARTPGEFLHFEASLVDTLIPVEGLSASLLGEQAVELSQGSPQYLRGVELSGQMAPHATLCAHDGGMGTYQVQASKHRATPGYVPNQSSLSKPIYAPKPISLSFDRPFHAQRFREALPELAQSCTYLRGRLWVASAPGHQIALSGAGPRVWLESAGRWESRTAQTLIVAVGSEHQHDELNELLASCQLSDAELLGSVAPGNDFFSDIAEEGGER